MGEPTSVPEAFRRAVRDPAYKVALIASLKRYSGCPACDWSGRVAYDATGKVTVTCESCRDFRREFGVRDGGVR